MERINLQRSLFGANVDRLGVLAIEKPSTPMRAVVANVWRNHNFETIEAMASRYLWWAGLDVVFEVGDYDDSFSFGGHAPADLEIVWMDPQRHLSQLGNDAWETWLTDRIADLRSRSTAPIVVAIAADGIGSAGARSAAAFADTHCPDLSELCRKVQVPLLDGRVAALQGSPVSRKAQWVLARQLACHWLPASILPPVKALALDLDHTLYRGVLGEDGVEGLELTEGHARLQQVAATLADRGVFVGVVSKNEAADVDHLLGSRTDFPLASTRLAFREVSWGEKADAIERSASELRIGTDAILFVDDNPGELMAVASRLPAVATLFAEADATVTAEALEHFPGLWRWKVGDADAVRLGDLRANAERAQEAARHSDPAEYRRSLRMRLEVSVDDATDVERLAELAGKTNQFNMSLRRFGAAELELRRGSMSHSVVGVRLSDRLSDSGLIALVVAAGDGHDLTVEELCISCRALGRSLETQIVLSALQAMPAFAASHRVVFEPVAGPRNGPALEWLKSVSGATDGESPDRVVWETKRIAELASADGVEIVTKGTSK